ncbi:cation:proton antiporter [Nocardioides sp. zg-1230]|uniref:cation:proton antiporter domain-containing protein n=1 Tax=Nocardioides sp. zg-1230 TaxID=2736601 RepID=UPI001C1324F1
MDVALLLVCFAALLVVGVLLSELANRTVLSTAVLFLVGGFVLGPGVLGVLDVQSGDPAVSVLAELALFSVLFSDGMRVGVDELRAAWRLPGRALVLGLPLTLLVTAALGHWVAGLPWLESLLLGAVLSPTDPVFAAAIVGRREVPGRLRHLLNVESGVNDGLALPVVLVLLAAAGGTDTSGWALAEELALGIVIGVGVPWVVLRLERLPFLASVTHLQPLLPAALGLLVLGLCLSTHANLFLGAFAAGATVATMSDELRHEFEQLGELVAEQLKLAAVLLFAALMTPTFLLEEISWTGWAFAVLALVVARPLALWVAFLGSGLGRREQAAAMWFGPKGFASVVYGLIVLESGIGLADELFHLTALTVSLSILAHSSTDVVVARQFVTDDVDSR